MRKLQKKLKNKLKTTMLFFLHFLIVLSASVYCGNTSDIDYYFDVGVNSNYKVSESFGCITTGCAASRSWEIKGICINPTLSISAVETDYDGSLKQLKISLVFILSHRGFG